MAESGRKFAKLLSEAIQTIKIKEDKNISLIQDQLGDNIGKKGGSSIEYWRRGNVPKHLSDAVGVARQLVQRKGLENRKVLKEFLLSAGHPPGEALEGLCNELFPATDASSDVPPVENEIPPRKVPLQRLPQVQYFTGRDQEIKQISVDRNGGRKFEKKSHLSHARRK